MIDSRTSIKLNVALIPLSAQTWQNNICIVIDVLRASSSIVTMFKRGANRVIPVETMEKALHISNDLACLKGGEEQAKKIPGFDMGNSPVEISGLNLQGQTVAFLSTNGTRTINALPNARQIVVGCFLNASACCQSAVAWAIHEQANISIVCAGNFGEFAIDDAACAGYLAQKIENIFQNQNIPCQISESAIAAIRIFKSFNTIEELFTQSLSGHFLYSANLEEDIPFCAQVDYSNIVPLAYASDEYIYLEPADTSSFLSPQQTGII